LERLLFCLAQFHDLRAWIAFGVLAAGNLLAVLSNCSELWNSIAAKNSIADLRFHVLVDAGSDPLTDADGRFRDFGVLLVANRAIAFGVICLLAIPEMVFALYCMHAVDLRLQQTPLLDRDRIQHGSLLCWFIVVAFAAKPHACAEGV
jgi:hypothetical protein